MQLPVWGCDVHLQTVDCTYSSHEPFCHPSSHRYLHIAPKPCIMHLGAGVSKTKKSQADSPAVCFRQLPPPRLPLPLTPLCSSILPTVAECRAASKPPQLPVGRRLSGHKTWDAVPRRHSQKLSQLSRAETEYYDAESCHGSDHSDHQLPTINSTEELETIASQLQEQLQLQQQPSGGVPGVSGAAARLASGGSRPPWVPETPLLFAREWWCCCCCCVRLLVVPAAVLHQVLHRHAYLIVLRLQNGDQGCSCGCWQYVCSLRCLLLCLMHARTSV